MAPNALHATLEREDGMSNRSARNPALIWLAAAIALVGYALIWAGFKPMVFAGVKTDFSCFYRAGRMVVAGDGRLVYDLPAQAGYDARLGTRFVDGAGNTFSLPFVFPPYTLAVFAPLAYLPYRYAEFFWYMANVAMLLALPFALRKKLTWNVSATALAMLAPVLFIPAVLALMQGQPSILLLLLLAVVFGALSTGSQVIAGSLLACAIFKPQLALPMLLALTVWRQWRALVAFACACVGLLGLSGAMVGWTATLHYPSAVLEFNHLAGRMGGEHPESMPNLRGLAYILVEAHTTSVAARDSTIAVSLLLLLAMAIFLKRYWQISEAGYALVMVVTLLVSYHAYLHDTSLLLLPFFLMAGRIYRQPWTVAHIGLAALMVAEYVIPLAPTSLRATAMQMCVATLMLAALLGMEIRTMAASEPSPTSKSQVSAAAVLTAG
jgi:hypothetical protein